MSTFQTPLTSVTPRGVVRTSRLLFAGLAALLGPLVAQSLFGASVTASALGLVAVVAPLLALWPASHLGRGAVARVAGTTLLAGVACGVVCSVAWVATGAHGENTGGFLLVAAIFGALYGAFAALGFAAAFVPWALVVRAALRRPSALGAHRLTVDAGVVLALAGAGGAVAYRVEALQVASALAGLVGFVVVGVALARVLILGRQWRAVSSGAVPDVRVEPRAEGAYAPALLGSPVLDHLVVRSPAHADVAPFRGTAPAVYLAAVPGDAGAVRKAIGATARYALGALALVVTLDAASALRPYLAANYEVGLGRPCHLCDPRR